MGLASILSVLTLALAQPTISEPERSSPYEPSGPKITGVRDVKTSSIDLDAVRRQEAADLAAESAQIERTTRSCPESCRCYSSDEEDDMQDVFCDKRGSLITSIPREIPSNAYLVQLAENKIVNIDQIELSGLGDVRVFNISRNGLAKVEERAFASLHGTETLDLSFNKLFELDIRAMRSLSEIDLSFNKFTTVPSFKDESGYFLTLEKISLTRNPIEDLDLSGNAIKSIPEKLPVSLNQLILHNNHLTNLQEICRPPDSLYSVPEPGKAALEGSKLKNLHNLRGIDFSMNQFTHFCIDDFVNLEDLEFFNASSNQITEIPGNTFSFARELKVLDLHKNSIQELNFANLPNLRMLDVSENQIRTSVDPYLYGALEQFDARFNPFQCDCQLKKFVQFVQEPGRVKIVGIRQAQNTYKCQIPRLLGNLNLLRLTQDKLVCENEKDENEFRYLSILAPISIVVILGIVVTVVFCASKNRRHRMKMKDLSGRNRIGVGDKVVTSGGVAAKNLKIVKNDAAILCHINSQKWVTDIMLPTLKQKPQESQLRCEKLYIDVFTIKSQVKNEKLRRCVEQNKRVIIIITTEFASSDACLFCLQAIYDLTRRNRKDGIVLVVLEPIPWNSMPHALKILMAEKTFIQYPVEDVGRQTFYFWDALRASIYADQLEQVTKVEEGRTTRLTTADDGEENYDDENEVDDIYNGIDQMKQQILEKSTNQQEPVTNLIKLESADPSELKRIGDSTAKLPVEIEIENPYRDAQILHEMATATSKNEVLEIHEDLEDLYQKRHSWQRPRVVVDNSNVWTGQKFSLPQGDDAESMYSRDNNGIPKLPAQGAHIGSIPNQSFSQPNAGGGFDLATGSRNNGLTVIPRDGEPERIYSEVEFKANN
ncbi:Oidioi.mRNA.OKI2018_I69.chr2.g7731.t1.cds [Oikopleura dioica]|uniref:Oidioi.mRNA.OKI2018_I69.chr2.g7731.t1.cds n=1 Tax=Oikopleura dioica TaxID=34765 RepID=A0ABN7TAN9_OIKDI|nr:Oidioi.mRNA.OKI2018_I69.chr2.g7731.t1.cds [Oikopleura dioica]